jgi:hypothetical protein
MSDDIKEIVKEKYARAALRVTAVDGASCCGSASSRGECDPITSGIYAGSDTSGLPAEARAASLGCGNPTALAELKAGETVLAIVGIIVLGTALIAGIVPARRSNVAKQAIGKDLGNLLETCPLSADR